MKEFEDNKYRHFVNLILSNRCLLEQVAEEASELSQASLKLIRTMNSGNPTTVNRDEAMRNLEEEVSDLLMLFDLLDLRFDDFQGIESSYNNKWERWARRLGYIEGESQC